jgi:hypothetical protein
MKKIFLTLLLSFFIIYLLPAQDLNCKITITAVSKDVEQNSNNKRLFEDMERVIFEFMNNRKWTNDVIQTNERIDCNLIINITKQLSSDEFEATAQIQSSRPVYNTSYNSTLFNFSDENWTFRYVENQTLEYSDNEARSNLTSLLAYYAYIMIGLDYDSFSLLGGTSYFEKARMVVSNAVSQPGKGWKAFDGTKNRFILVENLLDNRFKPLREVSYTYHRLGLDIMSQNIDNGRKEIYDVLPSLQKVYKDNPNSMYMNVFFAAKSEELINIFSKAVPTDKPKVVQILSDVDPSNISKYQQILRN